METLAAFPLASFTRPLFKEERPGIEATFPCALAECVQSQWNAYPMSCNFYPNEMRVLPLWNLPMEFRYSQMYCYIYSFFITSNITISSLLTFQEHRKCCKSLQTSFSLPLPNPSNFSHCKCFSSQFPFFCSTEVQIYVSWHAYISGQKAVQKFKKRRQD